MAARENPSSGDDHGVGPPSPDAFDELLADVTREHTVGRGGESITQRGEASPSAGPAGSEAFDPAAPRGHEPGYAPVPLGGSDPDEPDSDGRDVGAREDGVAPASDPAHGQGAASGRARTGGRDPWRRPPRERELAGRARSRALTLRAQAIARVVAAAAVVAALVGVLFVLEPFQLGGAPTGGAHRVDALALERRAVRLEAALRRESGQRYAWEMWAREFDPERYRKLKRRARAAARNDRGG